ncbi:FKBP-type peptidyl-prolyl cis-trans isomerase [Massilia sp. GCM10023247]|uniref:FKBP-type peptidyl-prolyl cis-trans isomerase n=1 Tax=Massilia sp. GCM10023247 TaxID=3252643 RepID=UPI0036094470
MRCHALLLAAGMALSACGGGGGDGGTQTAVVAPPTAVTPPATPPTTPPATPPATPVTPPATASVLEKYAGTWYGPCQGRMQDTATLARAGGGADALQLNLVRNFHDALGCTGSPIASETLSADFSLTYTSTATAPAALAPNTAAVPVALDLVTIAVPAYTRTRSGPAVTTTVENGVRNWCIAYSDGPVCSADAGQQPAASAPGALYLDKGELVLLSPVGAGYLADSRYTKDRASTPQGQGPAFQRIDTTPGSGTLATSGRTLTVHYTGWLYDASKVDFKGAQFDTSVGRAPFTFRLGAGQVIQGWEQGLTGMRVGGKRTLIVPASMAYGRAGSGSAVPPDAALLFEIELIGVQ